MGRRAVWPLLAAAVFAVSGTAVAEDGDTIHVDLRISGAPYPGKGCTGGDWRLRWKGELPAEGSSISDMLISYSAFDTTNEEDRDDPAAEIYQTPLVCRDDEGKITLRASLQKGPSKIRGVLLLKDDPVQGSPGFWFDVEDAGFCQVQGSGAGGNMTLPVVLLGFRTSQGTTLSPEFRLTEQDLRDPDGFIKRYAISGTAVGAAFVCFGSEISGRLALRYKRKSTDPSVTLAGCAKLPVGQSTTLGATVDPEGGSLRFRSDPSSAFALEPSDRDVQVTASSPGKGHITAEYEYDGQTVSDEVDASSLKLVSVNGDVPLPKLGLLGVDGKPTNKVYTFPFVLEPSEAGLDVNFDAEDAALATVNGHQDSIDIQPLKEGKTILSARTTCGEPIGTPVELEIVPCDDEVIEELKKQESDLKRIETEIRQRITQLTGDAEFERAAGHIREAIINLASKGGQLIINSLTLGESQAAAGGASSGLNAKSLAIANNLIDVVDVLNDAHAGNYLQAAYQAAVTALNDDRAAVLKSTFEAAEAAQQFGQDVGTLTGVAEQLQNLEPKHDSVRRQLYDVQRRQALCKQRPPPPKGTEPTPPEPPEPPAVEPPPTTEIPPGSGEAPPADETPPEAQPPRETPPTEETPPDKPPPKVVGGPMCVRKEPTVDAAATNLSELVPAASEFLSALTASRATLEATTLDPNAMAHIGSLPAEQRAAALAQMDADFRAYQDRFFALGELARQQRDRFDLCTENLPPGVESLPRILQ